MWLYSLKAGGSVRSIAERVEFTNCRPTGFDYLRVFLALGVIVWHSFGLSYGIKEAGELAVSPFGALQAPIVPMFFALSGFLVAGSLGRNSIFVFIGLRALRIIPALAVEVCLSALVLGPLVTTYSLHQYFADSRFHLYLLNIIGDIHYLLPGVFHTNPYPDIVNGQLWTVPWEGKCYIALTVFALVGIMKRRSFFLVALIASSIALWALHVSHDGSSDSAPLFVSFLAGVAIFQFGDILPWDWRLALVAFIAMVALLRLPEGPYFAGFPCAYFTVWLGLLNPAKISVLRNADYSYGLYVYGFSIQQTVAHFFRWSHLWYLNLAITIPLSVAFAAFSWKCVERPALQLRAQVPRFVAPFKWRLWAAQFGHGPVTEENQAEKA